MDLSEHDRFPGRTHHYLAAEKLRTLVANWVGLAAKQAGMKLRHEIYESGDSHDVTVSIEKFLGGKQSIQPFLRKIGIGLQEKKKAAAGPSQESR
jgi:Zn-dependent oligopeptidase